MKVIGIIPARFKSSRFPAKMLHPILGVSLLQRTYESALGSKTLDSLIIATDDKSIFEHAAHFGAPVIMTSVDCLNGTERLVDAIERTPEIADGDIYVNIQGDRPVVPGTTIDAIVDVLKRHPHDPMSTALSEIDDPTELYDPSTVKCVVDQQGYALYFSRAPIPWARDDFPGQMPEQSCYFRHIGLYAYRGHFLKTYPTLAEPPIEQLERLEQLRVLYHGYKIHVDYAPEPNPPGVDTAASLNEVRKLLEG